MNLVKTAIFLTSLVASTATNAATWVLSDVTFDDGSTATGSFDYENGIYSNFNIVTEGNGSYLGSTWTDADNPDTSTFDIYFRHNYLDCCEYEHLFHLFFDTEIDNSLTSIGVSWGYEDVYGIGSLADLREVVNITGGEIINTSAVPAPAAVWLFGSGLIGLAGFARKHGSDTNFRKY